MRTATSVRRPVRRSRCLKADPRRVGQAPRTAMEIGFQARCSAVAVRSIMRLFRVSCTGDHPRQFYRDDRMLLAFPWCACPVALGSPSVRENSDPAPELPQRAPEASTASLRAFDDIELPQRILCTVPSRR